jgi:hypothetical protein
MKKLILIVGLTAALSAPAFAATNLVVNGDFTAPSVGGYGQFASIPGWTSGNGDSIEIGANGTYGLSTVGSGFNLEVNSNTFGDVSQTVTGLVVGNSYTLSYLYGGRPGGGAQALDVSFGGVLLTNDTGSIGSWTSNSFTVVATSTSEVLEFKSLVTTGSPSYGNEISTVSVTAVPELSTWGMMLAGFAGLGFVGYRRQNSIQA